MKTKDVHIGSTYWVLVSGKVQPVRLNAVSPYGGWMGTNVNTGRQIRIRTAAKLRSLYARGPNHPDVEVSYLHGVKPG